MLFTRIPLARSTRGKLCQNSSSRKKIPFHQRQPCLLIMKKDKEDIGQWYNTYTIEHSGDGTLLCEHRQLTGNCHQNVSKRCSQEIQCRITWKKQLVHSDWYWFKACGAGCRAVTGQTYVGTGVHTQMPPECEEIDDHGVSEKISCIDNRIKEHLQFSVTSVTQCGANVNSRSSPLSFPSSSLRLRRVAATDSSPRNRFSNTCYSIIPKIRRRDFKGCPRGFLEGVNKSTFLWRFTVVYFDVSVFLLLLTGRLCRRRGNVEIIVWN